MTDDPPPLLSIGAFSRASGLTVSALRFYDRAGVLAPAWVDDWSGYRRYSPDQVAEARFLAGMRRVQVPVAEMAATLEALRQGDRAGAHDLLAAHLRRLEEGLEEARSRLAQLQTTLSDARGTGYAAAAAGAPGTGGASGSVPTQTFRTLLTAVRHASGTDPQFPFLMSVLVEVGEELTLVATDRYRMVVAGRWHRSNGSSTTGSVVLPTGEVDRLEEWLANRHTSVFLSVSVTEDGRLVLGDGTDELRLSGLDESYPDYRAVLEHAVDLRPLAPDRLQDALDGDDEIVDLGGLLVDRGYLLDAVSHVPGGQVLLPTGGVIAPLVVRAPDDADVLALVMPVAPERP